jgi:hypothetical protein
MLKTDYLDSLNNWNEKQTDNWKSKFKESLAICACLSLKLYELRN